ncbi:hypothetical protein BYT27DRAFT_7261681 [Phlegmacium glaucopus]|nr:hypothetical protein BYT27DRAFT_7261681 [Phlegmacium glaucopus]
MSSTPGHENKPRLKYVPDLCHLSFYAYQKLKAIEISYYGAITNVTQMAGHYQLNDLSWPEEHMTPGDVICGVLPFFMSIHGIEHATHL